MPDAGTSQERSREYSPSRGLYGERGWTRTIDPCLKRALLCQLSYAPTLLTIYHNRNRVIASRYLKQVTRAGQKNEAWRHHFHALILR